ncbi:peptidase S10, serine carboxypeptidase [Pelagophyceae sp. CCMP2097]|nr:peptidase S10, serine carboxypeptidase [Pelagophyceae sp. CCMP2097]
MRFATALIAAGVGALRAAPQADLVTSLPGFEAEFEKGLDYEIFSGYLDVPDLPKATTGYTSLRIHYELHTCAKKACPLAVWHQGGPGGSAIYGAWTEMGPFQVMASGFKVDAFAWNAAAHMLYLESPAGSATAGPATGFSTCAVDGVVQKTCAWDDVSQAVAYAHTLKAFFVAFPEFAGTDLFLVGESYAGQYIPNIASHVIHSDYPFNISGIAVGNGCWGGTANSIHCNGPNAEAHDVEMFWGKGLLSNKLYSAIQDECDFSVFANDDDDDPTSSKASKKCNQLLDDATDAVGPHNVYFIYDDCPLGAEWLSAHSVHPRWLKSFVRERPHLSRPQLDGALRLALGHAESEAGFPWDCESDPALNAYFSREDVKEALHLGGPGSDFQYDLSGPASVLLYPELVKHMRVLIFNGDSDACVPYKGNEEWTTGLATAGIVVEAAPWRPWYAAQTARNAPSGYVTTYTVPGKVHNATGPDFAFLTVRLAGHMVPTFQPEAALALFQRFVSGARAF